LEKLEHNFNKSPFSERESDKKLCQKLKNKGKKLRFYINKIQGKHPFVFAANKKRFLQHNKM
jgi:hypothetical protein